MSLGQPEGPWQGQGGWGRGCGSSPGARGRRGIEEATEALTQLEGELTATQDKTFNASHILGTLERSARGLNVSLHGLAQELHRLKDSNFLGERHWGQGWSWGKPGTFRGRGLTPWPPVPRAGAYDSVRQSHAQSQEAERRANASSLAVPSPVRDSAAIRRRAEQLLTRGRDDFNRKNAASRRALIDLEAKASALHLHRINEKVGPGCGKAWGRRGAGATRHSHGTALAHVCRCAGHRGTCPAPAAPAGGPAAGMRTAGVTAAA